MFSNVLYVFYGMLYSADLKCNFTPTLSVCVQALNETEYLMTPLMIIASWSTCNVIESNGSFHV